MPSIIFDGDNRAVQKREKRNGVSWRTTARGIPWPLIAIVLCLLAAWWIGH